MAGKTDFKSLVYRMDESVLRGLVLAMAEQLGEKKAMDIARKSGCLIETDPEKVREMALSALDVSYEELLDADDHDECGRYLCESEIADVLMVGIVNETFRSDVDVLLRLGRREDAMNVIRGIVDALRETESYITE